MNTKSFFQKFVIILFVISLVASLTLNRSFVQSEESDSSAFWLNLALNAWNYFKPGIGIDSQTGLPQNGVGSSYFTDWDTGLYIQAILNAEKIVIINSTGVWGADDRINRVLTFLEKRPLMADGLPYIAYSSSTYQNATTIEQVATDAGCLFVALKNLETSRPDLKTRIDNIVYNRTNYERREISVDILLGEYINGKRAPNIYDYYVTCGFAGFWPDRFSAEADAILNLIVTSPNVNYQGVLLPSAKITSEPLLMYIFEFKQPDARVIELSKQVYLAQEARYNLTGKFTAFSEGSIDDVFIWEWVVMPDGRMWVIQTGDHNDVNIDLKVTPVVYFKAAAGFLALYNTSYAQRMVDYLLKAVSNSAFGYYTGVSESGSVIGASRDVGNSLIISAARYAIERDICVPLTYPTPIALPTSVADTPTPTFERKTVAEPPTSTNSPTKTLNPSAESSPSVLPEGNQNSLPDLSVSGNGFYLVSAASIIVLLLVFGYRVGKKSGFLACE